MYVIILLVILLIIVYFSAGYIIKEGVSIYVPKVTGTPASVENVDLSLFKGQIEIKGLKVGNPAKYTHPNVFELGRIYVKFDPKSVLGDTILINQVLIENTNAAAEISQKGNINLMDINKNVQNFTQSSAKPAAQTTAKSETKSEGGKKVVIKDLQINNTALNLAVANQKTQLKLPNIQQKNIGEGKKSNTIPETIALIMGYFTSESLTALYSSSSELVKGALSNVKNVTQESLNQAKSTVKNIGAGLQDSTKAVQDSAKGLTDQVKGLKNLFGK
jgi:hypothetical protein